MLALIYGMIYVPAAYAFAQDLNTGSASASSPGLQVSNDGSCGAGLTCAGSLYGQCCSQHGFCGSGAAYCGDGCQLDFGFCGSLALLPPSSTQSHSSSSTTFAPGQTVTLTRTLTMYASGLFMTTATAVISRTEVRSVTPIATIALTPTALSTSVIYSVFSVYVTRNLTQVILETSTMTAIACGPTVVPTTTTPSIPPEPSPTLVGSPATCTKWHKTQNGENCNGVASKNGITLAQLMTWNPVGRVGRVAVCGNDPAAVVGLCRVNCDALWPGY